jgi:hypothetical protein
MLAHLSKQVYSYTVENPKLTLIDTPKPESLEEEVKDNLRANKLPFPQCPNCFKLDYEFKYIAGTKTKVCMWCWKKHERIVTMR